MEIVVGIILVLSLFGNYQQAKHNEALNNELEYWQEVANENRTQWLTAIEVNENNANTITLLKQAIDECEIRYTSTVEHVNDFREASAFKDAALADLRTRLSNTDFGSCRVPDWVDFGNTNRSD